MQTLTIPCSEIKKIEEKSYEEDKNYDFENFGKTRVQIRNEQIIAEDPNFKYVDTLLKIEEDEEYIEENEKDNNENKQ